MNHISASFFPAMIAAMILVIAIVALTLCIYNMAKYRKQAAMSRPEIESLRSQLRHIRSLKKAHTVTFLNLHAAHTDKMEEVLRVARRKLIAGQIDDLHRMLKSQKPLDEQAHMFNEMFDRVVFDVFPNFISEVNTLLEPERRFADTGQPQLTTELRILASIRLGVEDTATVAKILRLSHNTIYTYRNKLRSRALDRDSFDQSLRELDVA